MRIMDGDTRSKKRLICLDTESSIQLSIDRSLYGDIMARASSDKGSTANGTGSARHSQLLADDMRTASSGSHFVPRIHEVHGSSDSQLRISSLDLAGKLGGTMAPLDDSQSMSTNDESMATADMVLADSDSPRDSGAGVGGANADMELQAAIDQMLQGQPSAMGPPHSAYLVGGSPRQVMPGAGMPVVVPFAFDAEGKKPALVQRIAKCGRGLGSRAVKRFSRRSDTMDGLPGDSMQLLGDSTPKLTMGRSAYVAADSGKPECVEYSASPQGSNVQSRVAKLAAPLVRYMQRRPMAALGVVLGVFVALLAIIVVIMVVGVFPYLMRATLQDVSFQVTSVRAAAPLQVTRALVLNRDSAGAQRLNGAGGGMRLAEEKGDSVPNDSQHGLALRKRDGLPVPHHPHPSAVQRVVRTVIHTVVQHPVPAATHSAARLPPRRVASPASATSSAAQHVPSGTPAVHSSSSSELHPPSSVAPVAVAAAHPLLPTTDATHNETESTQMAKALDAGGHADSYTMQLGGSLNSGGPIGIDIEFTEPLRMYWRDMEVGSIRKPEPIHVPGHGSANWRWSSFTVSMPGAASDVLPVLDRRADKKLVVARGLEHSDARAADAGDQQASLAGWFAAIQAHGSFTMEWRSRVRVSAMGMHTSNVKFEKTVHVSCASASQCTIGE
ncbi:hypothetical protein H4R19_000957 [Coemansia spiralis]|nr:hypothetical protein H4R19_000957 [Coemansia spiralis]